ncbi:hypothetical protein R5W24_000835 [Gemmata sp. JC717]|uniref:Lipoprotein n=1 Tax=Gemmata algarum TaxID=2975278 RepID=A0ABU5EX65_9BACT|nr:hypothetical protein [Gemmata algarum]MDY3551756.1 hypothetical protein [Gemmata algarum]MDY3559839.1 hypothetical protein [Gemmata algarum]
MNHRLKRGVVAVALVACAPGCSNAPVAGFLDNCFPSKVRADGAPNPGPSVQPGGDGGLPKTKDDDKLPPPDFGPKP